MLVLTLPMPFMAGSPPVTYLMEDRFTTDAAAPLATPRSAEPGPGTWTSVGDSSNFSISGGALNIGGSQAANIRFYYGSQARQCGRALLFEIPTRTTLGAALRVGFFGSTGTGAATTIGVSYNSTSQFFVRLSSGGTPDSFTWTTGTHQFACIMRGTGGYVFVRNSDSGPWTLAWMENASTALQYPKLILNAAVAYNFTTDNWRVTDLAAPFDTDWGLATSYTASPTSGATGTHEANGWAEMTWTPAAGETFEMSIRQTDANNRWIVRCAQAGSTIKLIERNAGGETERASSSQTWTAGTPYRIIALFDGTTIKTWVGETAKNNYASASFNQSATGAAVSGFATGSNFATLPRYVTLPEV